MSVLNVLACPNRGKQSLEPGKGIRRAFAATGLVCALLSTAACGGGADANPSTATKSPSTEASATPSPTASGGAGLAADQGPVINGIPTQKELVSDAHGEYRQTAIAPDDPAFTFDSSVIEPTATERYNEEEIEQAHRAAVEYAVVAIDSPMNGSPGDEARAAQWWSVNQERFVPHQRDGFWAAVVSPDINDTVVYKGTHRDGVQFGLQYGNDVAHIVSRSIETKSIYGGEVNGENAIAVTLEVNFSNAVVKDGKKGTEYARGDVSFTLMKDASSGAFLINGISATYTTSRL